MLTLVFPKTELTSASIPVRWCVDEEGLDKATEHGLSPFVLFQIDYESGHESSFKLYPLDQFSAYLDVHYPGKISIRAWTVVATQNNKDAIRRVLMAGKYDRQTTYAFNTYTTKFKAGRFEKTYYINTFDESVVHEFNIDSSFFGEELPESVKFFINRYWYSEKPKDECAQRRRIMLFPFTTMLPLFVETMFRWLWNFILVIGTWLTLIWTSPSHLWHPFDELMTQRDINCAPTFFSWMEKHISNGKLHWIAALSLIPFVPSIWILLILSAHFMLEYSWVEALYAGPGIIYAFALACICIVCPIYFSWRFLADNVPDIVQSMSSKLVFKFWSMMDKFIDWIEQFDKTTERKRELLLCYDDDGKCLPELTLKDKSVKLIFADIKNKVCRPMRG